MKLLLPLFFCLLSANLALSQGVNNLTGLQTAAAVDIVAQEQIEKQSEDDPDRPFISPRESELLFFAPVDQVFDAQLSIAAHEEGGEFLWELHEAFIASYRLIDRARFRIGHIFLNIGRLNRFHRHDWPFTTAPESHRNFFDDEGALDTGAEFGYLLPTSFVLDVTVGVTRGWNYGHSHVEGNKPITPTHYTRTSTFFGDALSGTELGFNYLGRTDFEGTEMKLYGFDLTHKSRTGRVIDYLFQSELYQRDLKPRDGDIDQTIGGYAFLQFALDPMWSAGIRADGYSVLSRKDAAGNQIENLNYAYVPQLTYKASEFSTVRFSYTYWNETVENKVRSREQTFELQFVYIIGAHPAHNF